MIQEIAKTSASEDITVNYFGEKLHFKRDEVKEIIKATKEQNRVLFLSQHLEAFKRFIEAKILNTIYVYEVIDQSELITSDNPVIIRPLVDPTSPSYNEKEYFERPINPFDPLNFIHLPIDNKHLLTIMPDEKDGVINQIQRQKISFPDVLLYNNDMERFSESWLIGTKKGLSAHIDDQDKYVDENEESVNLFEFMKSRALLMLDFTNTLEKNGITSKEFKNKVHELFNNEVVRSDPGFFELVKSIKSIID